MITSLGKQGGRRYGSLSDTSTSTVGFSTWLREQGATVVAVVTGSLCLTEYELVEPRRLVEALEARTVMELMESRRFITPFEPRTLIDTCCRW